MALHPMIKSITWTPATAEKTMSDPRMFVIGFKKHGSLTLCILRTGSPENAEKLKEAVVGWDELKTVQAKEDLEKCSAPELVVLYNLLSPGKHIKEFNTKTIGIDRVWAKLHGAADPVDAETPAPEDGAASNEGTEDMAKKKAAKTKAPKAAKEPKAGRKPAYETSQKITILVEEIPKRGGAAERFALMKNGMLVGTAIEKGVTMADLVWDSKKKFIKID